MFEEFLRYIKKEQLFFEKESKILVAVSGGIDSVVLLHLLLKGGYVPSIVHCNFHLRGKDSDRDEMFVRNLAKVNSLSFFFQEFDTQEFAVKNGISIEMAARDLRYDFFRTLCREEGFTSCLIAHHANDNVETFFINLLRGTGLSGLRGMLPKNSLFKRPLLFASRSDIEEYAKENGLEYRQDMTNLEDDYLRNYLRIHVIPLLTEANPRFLDHVGDSMRLLSKVKNVVDGWYESKKEEVVKSFLLHDVPLLSIPILLEKPEKDQVLLVSLKRKVNRKEQEQLAVKELQKIADNELFLELYLKEKGFSLAQIHQISEAISRKSSGKVFIPLYAQEKESSLLLERGVLFFRSAGEKPSLANTNEEELEKTLTYTLKTIESPMTILSSVNTVWLDAQILNFPLELRTWKKGDYFCPLGMQKRQKLSDFFNNLKYSSIQKKEQLLLCSGEDIIWIVGKRIDDRYKIPQMAEGEKRIVAEFVFSE